MMNLKNKTILVLPLLLGACAGMPDINPPEESQAKAPPIAREQDRMAPTLSGASVVYDSGIWVARKVAPQTKPVPEPAAKPTAGAAVETAAVEPLTEPARRWEVESTDKTLHQMLARWAAEAGWKLVWDIDADYEIEAHPSFDGTFEQVMTSVATSMSDAQVPIQMIFYEGNKVVRIVAKGAR